MTTDPVMDAFNRRTELRLASEKMPEPAEEAIAYGAHILSEWLDDAAPLHEDRYREPARAVLKFVAYLAASGGGT